MAPMTTMETPIISPAALRSLLEVPGTSAVLLDARADGAAYARGHLRGARRADLEIDLSTARDHDADPARGGRHPLPPLDRWLRRLGRWGIDRATDVAIYDDQSGANAAARAWWMLRAVGHERVAVLDGGFDAAVTAGIEVTTDEPLPSSRPPYPADSWKRPSVDMAQVDALRNDPQWIVLDVRSEPRFAGRTEPIDPIAGHIEGARNLPFAANLVDGRFKPSAELRAQYSAFLGAIPASNLIVHCGSGVTACHTLLALELAGIDGAALYVGSWGEWCRNGGAGSATSAPSPSTE